MKNKFLKSLKKKMKFLKENFGVIVLLIILIAAWQYVATDSRYNKYKRNHPQPVVLTEQEKIRNMEMKARMLEIESRFTPYLVKYKELNPKVFNGYEYPIDQYQSMPPDIFGKQSGFYFNYENVFMSNEQKYHLIFFDNVRYIEKKEAQFEYTFSIRDLHYDYDSLYFDSWFQEGIFKLSCNIEPPNTPNNSIRSPAVIFTVDSVHDKIIIDAKEKELYGRSIVTDAYTLIKGTCIAIAEIHDPEKLLFRLVPNLTDTHIEKYKNAILDKVITDDPLF